MKRREFALSGLSAAALAAAGQVTTGQVASGQEQRPNVAGGPASSYDECAKACSDCQRECDRCASHCAEMLGQAQRGQGQHGQGPQTTLRTCLDCADICGTAAQIVSRSGPFSAEICDACAEACKKCGDACRQHQGDSKLQACAEQCQRCEQACRNMVRTAQQGNSRQPR
jgi:hypothetical protein